MFVDSITLESHPNLWSQDIEISIVTLSYQKRWESTFGNHTNVEIAQEFQELVLGHQKTDDFFGGE